MMGGRSRARSLGVLAVALVAAGLLAVSTGALPLPSNSSLASLAPRSSAPVLVPARPGTTPPPLTQGQTDTERAIAAAYEAIRKDPNDTTSYSLLGLAYLQNVREWGDPSDYRRAEAAFAEALERDPTARRATLGMAQLALARHEFRAALEIAQQIVSADPRDSLALGIVGDAQTELGLYDEAAESIQTMVDVRPDLSSYSRVSYQRELRGNLEGALEVMKLAFRAGGGNVENEEYVRVLNGNLIMQLGDLDTAEWIYGASLQRYPGYVWALAGAARARAARGDVDAALGHYQQAIDRIPIPEFLVALGELQEAAGRDEETTRTYRLVRDIQGLYQANGVNTDLELALFSANHGSDPAAAVALARAAYADQPNIKAADALGWALYKSGELEEAREYAQEALRLDTKDGSFLFHAGVIARAQGDLPAARGYLSRAIEVQPHFSPLYAQQARAALAELTTLPAVRVKP